MCLSLKPFILLALAISLATKMYLKQSSFFWLWHFLYLLFITPLCSFLLIGFQGNFLALVDGLFPYFKFDLISEEGPLHLTEVPSDASLIKYRLRGFTPTNFIGNMPFVLIIPALWLISVVFLLMLFNCRKAKDIKANRAYYNIKNALFWDGLKGLVRVTYLPLTFNALLCLQGLASSEAGLPSKTLAVVFAVFYLVLVPLSYLLARSKLAFELRQDLIFPTPQLKKDMQLGFNPVRPLLQATIIVYATWHPALQDLPKPLN